MSYSSKRREYVKRRYWERRQEAFKAVGSECLWCGCTEKLQLDHIHETWTFIPSKDLHLVSYKRFKKELSNLQPLCISCHAWKSNMTKFRRKIEMDFNWVTGREAPVVLMAKWKSDQCCDDDMEELY